MKNLLNVIAIVTLFISSAVAQEFDIKKNKIIIDGQPVALVDKDKKGYKISSMDGEVWFIINTINITQTKNVAIKFWIEFTGANGNIREKEYRELPFTFSKSKWAVGALLNSDSGLLGHKGVYKERVEKFFSSQDRSVSDKWDVIINKQIEDNAEEDRIAKKDGLLIDSSGKITLNKKERLGFVEKKSNSSNDEHTYTVIDNKGTGIASIKFRNSESSNNILGLNLKTYDGQIFSIDRVKYGFNKIELDDLTKRVVHKLYALGYLKPNDK